MVDENKNSRLSLLALIASTGISALAVYYLSTSPEPIIDDNVPEVNIGVHPHLQAYEFLNSLSILTEGSEIDKEVFEKIIDDPNFFINAVDYAVKDTYSEDIDIGGIIMNDIFEALGHTPITSFDKKRYASLDDLRHDIIDKAQEVANVLYGDIDVPEDLCIKAYSDAFKYSSVGNYNSAMDKVYLARNIAYEYWMEMPGMEELVVLKAYSDTGFHLISGRDPKIVEDGLNFARRIAQDNNIDRKKYEKMVVQDIYTLLYSTSEWESGDLLEVMKFGKRLAEENGLEELANNINVSSGLALNP